MGRYDAGRVNQGFSQRVVKADEERELNIRPGAQRHALASDRSEKVSGLFVSSKNKPDTLFAMTPYSPHRVRPMQENYLVYNLGIEMAPLRA